MGRLIIGGACMALVIIALGLAWIGGIILEWIVGPMLVVIVLATLAFYDTWRGR